MPPRILILSASVGAGHLRAAEAVEAALNQAHPDATVQNLDVLEMTNRLFRRVYAKSYLDLVNKAPHMLGYFYDLLDQPIKTGRRTGEWFRQVVQNLNLKPFIKFLKSKPWDLIINTHFLPAEIIAALKKDNKIDTPQATVVTDFDTHRLWFNQPCERYFVASPEGAVYLESWGVPRETIFLTGIPVHPVFGEVKDLDALRAKHGVSGDRPVLLQLAGGFGVGPIEKLYKALLSVETPIQLLAVCGRNEALSGQLRNVQVPPRHAARVLGFTKEIDELMAIADLVVSKPGGLTTSETLARGAVMVIVNPIPGQESRNSDFLLENGAAIKANNSPALAYKVNQLLKDRPRLERLRENVRRIATPRAAFEVVEKSLELIGAK